MGRDVPRRQRHRRGRGQPDMGAHGLLGRGPRVHRQPRRFGDFPPDRRRGPLQLHFHRRRLHHRRLHGRLRREQDRAGDRRVRAHGGCGRRRSPPDRYVRDGLRQRRVRRRRGRRDLPPDRDLRGRLQGSRPDRPGPVPARLRPGRQHLLPRDREGRGLPHPRRRAAGVGPHRRRHLCMGACGRRRQRHRAGGRGRRGISDLVHHRVHLRRGRVYPGPHRGGPDGLGHDRPRGRFGLLHRSFRGIRAHRREVGRDPRMDYRFRRDREHLGRGRLRLALHRRADLRGRDRQLRPDRGRCGDARRLHGDR